MTVFLLLGAKFAMAFPAQVIILRHAEKPEVSSPDLSEKGFQRARALARLFDVHPQLASNGTPDFIFSTLYIPGDTSRRTYQTVEPLAERLNLVINNSYPKEDFHDLADEILKSPKYNGRSIVISWTHKRIPDFAKALGSAPADKWKSEVFDRLWVIQYDHKGRAKSFELPQKMLPGDSTHLLFQSY